MTQEEPQEGVMSVPYIQEGIRSGFIDNPETDYSGPDFIPANEPINTRRIIREEMPVILEYSTDFEDGEAHSQRENSLQSRITLKLGELKEKRDALKARIVIAKKILDKYKDTPETELNDKILTKINLSNQILSEAVIKTDHELLLQAIKECKKEFHDFN